MKSILAGNGGGCTETNCWICDTGGFSCDQPGNTDGPNGEPPVPGDGALPVENGVDCSWGICSECCVG